MTDEDLKQMRGVFKEELKPVIDTLAEHTGILAEHTRKLDGLADQLAEVSVEVTEINFHGLTPMVF